VKVKEMEIMNQLMTVIL